MDDGIVAEVQKVKIYKQSLEDEIKRLGLQFKRHEDSLEFLKTERNKIDESIHDMQVKLANLHSSTVAVESKNLSPKDAEKDTIENVLQQEKTAASIVCLIKTRHGQRASKLPSTKDVLGVVANLGKVNDDNLSRLFSEYLGLETMLGIVCNTYEGARALEKYDSEGMIVKSSGVHGLGPSIGRRLEGRFLVFCLDSIRPYVDEFVHEDPQKRLALLKPRLPNGEPPSGFIGFAVNMIDVDHMHLSYLTSSGHGLRETLFYNLFSRLQVYKTRSDMIRAMPYISDGAVSLDGGIIRSSGVFYLGERKEVQVRFPVNSMISTLASEICKLEEQIKLTNWKKERLLEDTQREETLLNHVKKSLSIQTEVYLNYIKEAEQNLQKNINTQAGSSTLRNTADYS